MATHIRQTTTAAVLTAAVLTAALVPVTAAHAVVADLTCTGDVKINFDPALTPGGKVSGTGPGSLENCASPNGRWTDLKSAKITSTFKAKSAAGLNPCSLQLTISNVDAKFAWNTGDVSSVGGTFNTDLAEGMIGITADMKNGPLRGGTGTVAPVVARPNADCLTAGLKTLKLDLFTIVFQGADPPAG